MTALTLTIQRARFNVQAARAALTRTEDVFASLTWELGLEIPPEWDAPTRRNIYRKGN
jgi:hypothetical protein